MVPATWLLLGLLCLCSSASLVAHSGATTTTDDVNSVVVSTSWFQAEPVCQGLRGMGLIVPMEPGVQCRPCPTPAPCHAQKDATYDPATSSTFSNFSFCSPACARLGANTSTNNGCPSKAICRYTVNYSDGSNTTGTYSSDTLTLSTSSSKMMMRGFRFGCSHADPGFTSRADGILALSGGTESLPSQAGERAFSYCLPATTSQTGFLSLGVPPRASPARFAVVTRMFRVPQAPASHAVLLEAITVAGRRLDVPASAFSAGSIMDSGTIITRLPPSAYAALRAVFRAEMTEYPPAPAREHPRHML